MGYEPVELFLWEMCVQCLLHEASMKHSTSDMRDKLKSLIIKLQDMHGKEKFLLFMEKGKRIKIKTFPAKAMGLYGLFDYTVCKKGYTNVSLILHAMALMSFYNFKTPVYQWLQLSKVYMTKTIFKSSKDNVVCIGHLTNINLNALTACNIRTRSTNSLM
eukprot:15029989-Ditylum_brightwellii.AAC.1